MIPSSIKAQAIYEGGEVCQIKKLAVRQPTNVNNLEVKPTGETPPEPGS